MKDLKENGFGEQKDKHPMRCETCSHLEISGSDDSCPNEEICGKTGCTISPAIESWIEIHGCALHSSNESLRAPNSSPLIAMAHQEWKNREERKPNAPNERDWCSGWMDGFLSVDKPYWSKERAEKILPEKPCDICLLNDLAANDYEKLKEHDRAIEQAAREKVLDKIRGEMFKFKGETDCLPYCNEVFKIIESLRNYTNKEQNK